MRARELRQQVALVPQRTTVFSGTIAEAIRFGRRATDDEVRDAARLANADDFIRALPQGYDTQLEERGTNVSGGQLQRIAIARAVLGNPALLLLDEATSALDVETESRLYSLLRDREVAFISVGHRPTLKDFHDTVLELSGDHDWRLIPATSYDFGRS